MFVWGGGGGVGVGLGEREKERSAWACMSVYFQLIVMS